MAKKNTVSKKQEKKITIEQYFNIENIFGHPRMILVFSKMFANESPKTVSEWRGLVKKHQK